MTTFYAVHSPTHGWLRGAKIWRWTRFICWSAMLDEASGFADHMGWVQARWPDARLVKVTIEELS